MQRIRMQLDGQEVEVIAQRIQGRLWYHVNGETHVYETDVQAQKSTSSGASSADRIVAPMPGKILRVDVHPKDKVAKGKVLVVMEAMKMEYTLAAAADSEVEEVTCKTGDQVKLGQILVRLKEE